MKPNISVEKPLTSSYNSDNNVFFQQLIVLYIDYFRLYRSFPATLGFFTFLYIVKLRWYRTSLLLNYSKMSLKGIKLTSPGSGRWCFTTEPKFLLEMLIQFIKCNTERWESQWYETGGLFNFEFYFDLLRIFALVSVCKLLYIFVEKPAELRPLIVGYVAIW